VADVLSDIDKYLLWYASSGVDGFFIDEVSFADPAVDAAQYAIDTTYYSTIYNYVKNINPNLQIVLNPGAAQYKDINLYSDVVISFENTAAVFESWVPPQWQFTQDASRNCVLPHTCTTFEDMQNAMAKAKSVNAGWVYCTNEGLPGPWSSLPTGAYWQEHKNLIDDTTLNADPTSLVMVTVGNDIGFIFCDIKTNFVVRNLSDKYRRLYIDSGAAGGDPAMTLISADYLIENGTRYVWNGAAWSSLGVVTQTINTAFQWQFRLSRASLQNITGALSCVVRPEEYVSGNSQTRFSSIISLAAMGVPTGGNAFSVSQAQANYVNEAVGTIDLLAGTIVPTTAPNGSIPFQFWYTIAANP
jgi:hypothetical protein